MSNKRLGRAALAWRLAPLALAIAACAPTPTPTPGMPAPAAVTDANISSFAQTYNTGEVQISQLAVTRSTNPAVRSFAQMIAQDHNAANQELAKIISSRQIQPAPSSLTQEVQNFDSQTMASLQSRSGADFDRTYLDSEISHHQWVINQLDTVLIPQARDGKLRDYLKAGRSLEAKHLQQAQQLRGSLGGS
jgi:putative membrane protein